MNNKKGISDPIFLLVIGTLALSTLVLFYLNSHSVDSSATLNLPVNIDEIVNDARIVEFYLEDALIKSVAKTQGNLNPISFLEAYNDEIEKLKRKPENYNPDSDGTDFAIKGLEGIQDQLVPENVVINNGVISLRLQISLSKEHLTEDGSLNVNYNYKKTFAKPF